MTPEELAESIISALRDEEISVGYGYVKIIAPIISAAVAAERERCAKECENFPNADAYSSYRKSMMECAAAIRALK